MQCPKCGRDVKVGAFICPRCEFILDTSFLGDDITDDDREKRVALSSMPSAGGTPGSRSKSGEFGEDAIILGDGQGEYSDFSSRDAGGLTREVTQARFYIGGSTAALLSPDAVPEVVPGIADSSLKMSPFEMHVISFINGKRSIGRIHKKSAMEDAEFKVAVSMLADKGIIRLRTTKKKKKPGALSSMSQSARVPLPEGSAPSERTVVAQIELPPEDDLKPQRAEVRGSRTSNAEATIIKSVDASLKKQSKMPGFASMRIQEQDDEPAAESARDDVVDARGRRGAKGGDAGGGQWAENDKNNISNVFARAPSAKSAPDDKRPSLADAPPPRKNDDDDDVHANADANASADDDERFGGGEANDDGVNGEELLPPGGDDEFRFDSTSHKRTGSHKARGTDDGGLPEKLRNPTAIGDLAPVRARSIAADEGAPADDGDFDEPRGVPDEDSLEPPAGDEPDADERVEADDEDGVRDEDLRTEGLARRPPTVHNAVTAGLSDDPTGPLPSADDADVVDDDNDNDRVDADDDDRAFNDQADDDQADDRDRPDDDVRAEEDADQDRPPPMPADAEDEGFDVDLATSTGTKGISSANTASLPAKAAVAELPSDAMRPLPSKVMAAPAVVERPAPPVVVEKPAPPPLAKPLWEEPKKPVVALPGQSMPSLAKPAAQMGLPGQSLQRPGGAPAVAQAPNRPPTGLVGAARPSAGSKVGFEQARKAEKIFEVALKDHAEGRLSSARMNAKLAVMYDPSVETYAEFLKELDAKGADAKPPGGGKSRELLLFEAASEAEGKGDYDKAIDLLEEAVSINPKAAALRNRLGVVLSIRCKRHTEALDQLKIAIDLEPGNIVYMNNFSKVTALLDSQLQHDPEERKKKGKLNEKVEIKKMRPKLF